MTYYILKEARYYCVKFKLGTLVRAITAWPKRTLCNLIFVRIYRCLIVALFQSFCLGTLKLQSLVLLKEIKFMFSCGFKFDNFSI